MNRILEMIPEKIIDKYYPVGMMLAMYGGFALVFCVPVILMEADTVGEAMRGLGEIVIILASMAALLIVALHYDAKIKARRDAARKLEQSK